MKPGGYTLHQSLTLEAAATVKQALTLARRRGHAQVTPLHVAAALLSSSTGVLKRACLQSHYHPLQCKALELCFNVALNRLPTSASTPLSFLPPHTHIIPSLSNALVAAFKRAQAHQRRGSIESQQQSILALKVEIEQLSIAILDDPSVSRVMREAGFSSTQVKSNVEKAVSIDKSKSPTPSKQVHTIGGLVPGNTTTPALPHTPTTSLSHLSLPPTITNLQAQDDNVMRVVEAMMDNKTKNIVFVAEPQATAESLVREVIQTFNKKDVPLPAEMKLVQFISVPLFTLRNISRKEFETKRGELRSLVKSYISKGVVLYLGDLDWVSNFWSEQGKQRDGSYSPVEYMIMELSRMICGQTEEDKRLLWLMGTATPQTYAKCKIGRPSLETLWCLHSLRLSVGKLVLNLSLDSIGMYDQVKEGEEAAVAVDDFNWLFKKAGIKKHLNCCSDCSHNFKKEAQSLLSANNEEIKATSSSLPSWLQQYMIEEDRKHDSADQECEKIKDLCKKWNSICTCVHRRRPHFHFDISSSSPNSSSTSSNGHNKADQKLHQSLATWPPVISNEPIGVLEPNNKQQHQIYDVEVSKLEKPELLSNPNSSPNSATCGEASASTSSELHVCCKPKLKEFNSVNLKILSDALRRKIPWQKDIIPDIVSTILQCRSGMTRSQREDCWLFFLGADCDGKEIVARELAKAVFGSEDSYIMIGMSSSSSFSEVGGEWDGEEVSKKRGRNEEGVAGRSYERFVEAVRDNPRRVIYMELDVGEMEYSCVKGLKSAMRDGSVGDGEKVEHLVRDAIVILSSERRRWSNSYCCLSSSQHDHIHIKSSSSSSSSSDDDEKQKEEEEEEEEEGEEMQQNGKLDLNIMASGGEGDDTAAAAAAASVHDEIMSGLLELVDKQVVFAIQVL